MFTGNVKDCSTVMRRDCESKIQNSIGVMKAIALQSSSIGTFSATPIQEQSRAANETDEN